MRGRKPQPDELKKFKGTYDPRYGNPNAPKPRVSRPTCPQFLTKTAKAEWKRIAPELEALGLLTQLDRAALAGYCSAFGDYVDASKVLAKEGLVIRDSKGRLIPHPILRVLNKSQEQMKSFLVEFGMTPSSRSRLSVVPPSTGDPMEELLRGLGIS